ncbi:ribosomal RNA processing protein 1 homolog A isoform X2 [Trichosurus vulpecula]|uniref:ribosomal RNA processing protein 1 homolog A isoform X2 n=1 Tax=Trichosurus vulpecula TaxID=9337 RepID=UPI00186B27BA|nr:ribosomal RNA processing protein 1 homolog A isoform X2 [Trichosurus vulpecula]
MTPAPALPSEIQLAQRLAGNEKTTRDRAVRKLRRYIRAKTAGASGGFSHEELLKIWKGLFYCMWMQDKPLLQEELGNTISQLIHVFQNTETQHLFVQTFWQTMNREWIGIDRLRLDKFYTVELLLDILMKEIFHPDSQAPCGVKSHFIEIYLEELTKVGAKELTADQNLKFIVPFCKVAARTKDSTLLYSIVGGIFEAILEQAPFAIEDLIRELNANEEDSELEAESDDMTSIRSPRKQKKGKTGKDSSLSEDKPKVERRRDGKGHIGLVLQFNYEEIADRLFEMASRQSTPSLNRKRLYKLVRKFQSLAEGIFPQDGLPQRKKSNKNKLQQKKTCLPKSKLQKEKGKKDEKQNMETAVTFEKDKSRVVKRKGTNKRKNMSTDSSFPNDTGMSDIAVPLNPQNNSSGRACKRKKGQGPKATEVTDGLQEPNKKDETETQKNGKKQKSTDLEVMPAIGKSKKKDACKKGETKEQQTKNLHTTLQKAYTETPAVKGLPAHPIISPKPESNDIGTPKLVTKQRKRVVNGSNHIVAPVASKVSSEMVDLKELQLSRTSDLESECQDIDNTRMIKKKHKWDSRNSVVPPQKDKAKLPKRELVESTENPTDCDFLPSPKRPNRSRSRSIGSLKRKSKGIFWSLGPRMIFRSPGRRVKRSTRKNL